MAMTRTLLLLAIISAASPAIAEPCSTIASRYTIAETLRLAAKDRPVNVVFDTNADGVKLPDRLKTQFPGEMTVILQYQFERLTVKDDRFDLLLWFKGYPARLFVPFAAITQFWDRTELKCSGK
jgi:hypothetical protein